MKIVTSKDLEINEIKERFLKEKEEMKKEVRDKKIHIRPLLSMKRI